MEVKVKNSINLENIQNEDYLKSSQRFFTNKDIGKDFSTVSESNISHINESNNDDANNLDMNDLLNIVEVHDINNDLPFHNNNDVENMKKDTKRIKQLNKELINNNFVFLKDYYEQKLDENNKLYVSWLKNLYIKLKIEKNNLKNNTLNINQKIEIPDFSIIKAEIENTLFFCSNPQCNSIVYMTESQKNVLNKTNNLYYTDYYPNACMYNKDKCPICLRYKCIYCKKSSTFFNANCCIQQIQNASENTDYYSCCDLYCIFFLFLYFPILRSFYIANMINFELFRGLSMEKKLLQNKRNIKEMIQQNNSSEKVFGTYQSKFGRKYMIFIGLFNILGSTCWTIPFLLFIEIILIVLMIIGFFSKDISLFKRIINKYYLLAFIPGLRRNKEGRLYYTKYI